MFKKEIYIFIVALLLQTATFAQTKQHKAGIKLSGQVIDSNTLKGVSFASVIIDETGKGVSCDINGFFTLGSLKKDNYTIKISCLGYAPHSLAVDLKDDTSLRIKINQQSIALKEFSVMARYSPRKGSNVIINQAALEYVQPTSIQDVFLLLPGNIIKGNSMNRFGLLSSRQAGEDVNTSLGMGIIADGIPISNDATRIQMAGVTGYSSADKWSQDFAVTSKISVNSGVDSRNISTDHIESIEVVRGISSAKQGNLSSGAIHIVSKRGVSPLQIRAKADPLTKLLYAGKGFLLSEKSGTMHFGADILKSNIDIRDKLNTFTRATGQVNYNNKLNIWGKALDINAKFSQTFTTNKNRTDELTTEYDEKYSSNYTRSILSLKAQLAIESSYIDNLEALLSADYSSDFLKRKKYVISPGGPMSMPIAKEEGEHEGVFLPAAYYSEYSVDNRPLYLFFQLNGQSTVKGLSAISSRFIYGTEWRLTKNYGEGAVVDPKAPPFPGQNSFIRPRPNHAIPALLHGAFYLENKTQYKFNNNELELSAGVRATQIFNLPKNYVLAKRVLLEPRIQFQWTIRNKVSETRTLTNSFRLGYGEENKMPTLDHLYPDKVYRDFTMMNAYFQNPETNRLITYTRIHDMSNPQIKENKNRKLEFGWDVRYGGWEWSSSVFYEKSTDGFEYFANYYPVAFNRYTNPKPNIVGKPNKTDYDEEPHKDFTLFTRPTNSSKVVKMGIEYRLRTPEIKAIYTTIEINGAYYKTIYADNVPVMYRPQQLWNNAKVPYVGIYQGSEHLYRSRFNTNIWINTHIPQFKLIFTNFIQVLWFTSQHKGKEEQGYPSHYMDTDGAIHAVSKETVKNANDGMQFLMKERTELYYRASKEPVSIRLNFKTTKELGKKAKLSLFVDNIIDINPKYKRANKTTDRTWHSSFFGVELMLNL